MLVRYSTQYVLWSALDFLCTFSSDSLQLKNNDMITPLGLYPFIIKKEVKYYSSAICYGHKKIFRGDFLLCMQWSAPLQMICDNDMRRNLFRSIRFVLSDPLLSRPVHEVDLLRYQWRIQDFPEVGAPTLQGAPTYDFAKFSPKRHEIERIWTLLDPPLHVCIRPDFVSYVQN